MAHCDMSINPTPGPRYFEGAHAILTWDEPAVERHIHDV